MSSHKDHESFDDLERRLRSERPVLDAEVRQRLAGLTRREAGRGVLRPVLAMASMLTVLATIAGFGGVSYAFDSVTHAVGNNSASQGKNVTNGNSQSSSSSEYGSGSCIENVNPHGQTIPPAGQTSPGTNPKSGQNPDGFYKVSSSDGSQVWVIDMATGYKFGPFDSGTVIKYTQAGPNSADTTKSIGSTNGQAGAVYVHLTGAGDAEVTSVNPGGAISYCLVPRPPK